MESAFANAAGIGRVKTRKRARIVNLNRRTIVKADGELCLFGMHRDAERLLAALRGGLRFEMPIGAIAADLPSKATVKSRFAPSKAAP